MQLDTFDWLVIAAYGIVVLVVGLRFAGRAGQGTTEFFLSGRKLPWWLLGTSMVATTFSTDTPNFVTDLVRTEGVSANWLWWAFLITGMCTVFFYAKLWRRSGVMTDMGFYELRYSGKAAAFLRGFRAIYLGVFFNVMVMAAVTLAAIKISGVLLGFDKYFTVIAAGTLTVIYSATAGLWGVVVTDLLLFVISMVGALTAATYALNHPAVGGLSGLVNNPALADKISLLPDFSDPKTAVAIFVVPVAVQWWSTWYPGAEPGGGGYIAQRMLAARSEKDAVAATLWFNIAHYALRPWPWIIVALASLVVYPTLDTIATRFPGLDPSIMGHDLAYPAMLVLVPHGLLGVVVASLAAAYMSTISTHLNWGASYVVNDVYRRFIKKDEDEVHYVRVARLATIGLITLAVSFSLLLEHAVQAFQILLQIGAGTGLLFLLRWFWWRINAWSELSAMIISFSVAIYLELIHPRLGFAPLDPTYSLLLGVTVTTIGWITVTFLTPATDRATLQKFYDLIQPAGRGWASVVDTTDTAGSTTGLTEAFAGWFFGCVAVYAALFGVGWILYGSILIGVAALAVSAIAGVGIFYLIPRIGFR